MRHMLDEGDLKVRRQLCYHSPIQNAELTVRRSEQVARVWVAVKGSSFQHHCEIGVHSDTAENRDITLAALIKSLSVDPLRRQDFAGSALLDDGWGVNNASQRRRLDGFCELLGIARLRNVIQLINEAQSPCINCPDDIGVEVERPFENWGDLPYQVHIEGNLFHNVRPLNFQRYFPSTFSQPGTENLAKTRCCYRFRREF
mmetsp:Transcript_32581/g.96022  ORF Transcript_32581/g.96022 Transcript_32581/m.96022 type:complete len:201 (-) Transcript_32581:775-1377(-)